MEVDNIIYPELSRLYSLYILLSVYICIIYIYIIYVYHICISYMYIVYIYIYIIYVYHICISYMYIIYVYHIYIYIYLIYVYHIYIYISYIYPYIIYIYRYRYCMYSDHFNIYQCGGDSKGTAARSSSFPGAKTERRHLASWTVCRGGHAMEPWTKYPGYPAW